MANFLISTMPASGHVNPALPLAAELVRHDHKVWWHTGTAYADQVAAAGAHLVPFRHTWISTGYRSNPTLATRGWPPASPPCGSCSSTG